MAVLELFSEYALTHDEQCELKQCEETIERGLHTFHEVGAALLVVRDKRLYRKSHRTFEEYCRERWGMANSTRHCRDRCSHISGIYPTRSRLNSHSMGGLLQSCDWFRGAKTI